MFQILSQFSQIFSQREKLMQKKLRNFEKIQLYRIYTKNWWKSENRNLKFYWLHFINEEPKFWDLMVSKVILVIRPKNLGPWFIKSSQSNWNLQSSYSNLVLSYLKTYFSPHLNIPQKKAIWHLAIWKNWCFGHFYNWRI